METIVVLATGGIFSTVAAYRARSAGALRLLYLDWGQRSAAPRRQAVEAVARSLSALGTSVIELPHVAEILRNGAATEHGNGDARAGAPQPHPALAAAGGLPVGLMSTLLAAAVQFATRCGAHTIVCGASQVADEADQHAPPNEGTPDRRREFFFLYNAMLDSALPAKQRVQVETPFIDLPRADIVRLGVRFEVPFKHTRSCQEGGEVPCGTCPGCQARAQAFAEVGLTAARA